MAFGMIVQLPVSVPFGTDDEFDLRVGLESALAGALTAAGAGNSAGGSIDTSQMSLHLDGITDPVEALGLVKGVLANAGQLSRATIVLETRCEADPDDRDWQVLWPPNHSGVARVA